MGNNPISDCMVRIHKVENGSSVFITYTKTDANGKTGPIMLEAPSMAYSFDYTQQVCPYASYNVELIKEEYDIEEYTGVQIFANRRSSLPVTMHYCYPHEPRRNTVCIDDHKLFCEQGDSQC